ncbi:MAG: YihY/virulence factor BrkB family protein [Rubrobacteraceae bacterium]|jgi:membrane protein
MKIPGIKFLRKAEQTGNEVEVPLTGGRLGTVEMLKRTFKEATEDHLAAFAGNLTYKGLFALFPFFVFLLSLLGIFGSDTLLPKLLDSASGVLPASATDFISKQLLGITKSNADSAFTFGAIISILFALWGVSGAFRSIMEAMNVMYEIEEERPFWKVYGISIFLSLVVAVLLISALVLVVFGPKIAAFVAGIIGFGTVFQTIWIIVQWPVLLLVVLIAFALIYYFAPDVEQRFKWISPGSIAAVVLWLLFSLAFSLYVSNFSSYNKTYGSLAGVAILMLYIYYTSYILLLGAEMNQVIEEKIPEGKNEGEKTLNTPEKAEEKDQT